MAFERVEETFHELLRGSEKGMGFAAYVDGELVVDLWGGHSNADEPWQRDTLAVVFSCTKGASALCVQILADRGLLDVDAPVQKYWPEFASPKVLVKHCLTHTAGMLRIPGYDEFITPPWDGFAQTDEIARRIATSEPLWEPGTQMAYHAWTFGWLVGEIVRRIDGRTIGTFFHEEVAKPLGLDFWIGLPESEFDRLALPIRAEAPAMTKEQLDQIAPGSLWGDCIFISADGRAPIAELDVVFSRPAVVSAELAAGGGVTTARDLARMYAMLAQDGELDGARIVSPESIATHGKEEVAMTGLDGMALSMGLGYMRFGAAFGCVNAFGHTGAGGSLGLVDPERNVAMGFVHNQMHSTGDHAAALLAALNASID